MIGFRKLYANGVDVYYQNVGDQYQNPHLDTIKKLLQKNLDYIDKSGQILDLCAGTGQISQILEENEFDDYMGCDPFLYEIYEKVIGKQCLPYNFLDLIQFKLEGCFSSIICSFGMHLCKEGQLYGLIYALSHLSKQLVIISPHKRPDLSSIGLCQLIRSDDETNVNGKHIYLKIYQLSQEN